MKKLEVVYTSEDKSLEIKLSYTQKSNLKIYKGVGKSWPKQTQCIIEVNGLVAGIGQVVKHEKDPDNIGYAITACTKKAFAETNISREIRAALWMHVKHLAKFTKTE